MSLDAGGLLVKLLGLAILSAVACLILRSVRAELAPFVRIGGTVLMLGLVFPVLEEVVSSLEGMTGVGAAEPYVEVMLRALGISLLCRICSDVCRDAGEAGLASGVEMAGRLLILLLSVPLIGEILSLATELLEAV